MTNLAVSMALGERVAYAGKMMLIGLGAVFAVLAILWLSLVLFHLVLKRGEQKPAASVKSAASAPAAPAPAAPAPDNGALIAAITAAISVALAAENGGTAPAFRVVAFRRAGQ